jgi:hypothetical protein
MQGEMLLNALPRSQSHPLALFGTGFNESSPAFSQSHWIFRRHYDAGVTDDQRGIAHIRDDARSSARHGFTDYDRESFTARCGSGDIQSSEQTRNVMPHT